MDLKPLKYIIFTCSLIFLSAPSWAQAMDAECFAQPAAEITKLRLPEFGSSPNSWDIVYAQDGMDVFSDILPLDPVTVVAAGAYTKDKEDKTYHPLIVKFDEKLRPVWEIREQTTENRTIYRILKTKTGFTVLGDITTDEKGGGVYIASYTEDGKTKGKPLPVYEAGGHLDAKAFIPAQDGGGYIIVAQYTDASDSQKQHGILYKISNAGKIVWKRTYQTGQSNSLNNIQAMQDGNYIASGQIVLEGTKSAGWLLRLDQSGAIQWQRTYPRGQSASILTTLQTKDGDFIVAGKSRPFDYDGTHLSAWVMKTDSAGGPLWQRYFRGDYSYEAADMVVYEDGRASVLLNAGGTFGDNRSHARIITFSPQGKIMHLEDFTEGQNAFAHRLVAGLGGERILTGYAQTSFGDNQEGNEGALAPEYTFDGWVLAAPPLDLFEDPCISSPKMSPLLP